MMSLRCRRSLFSAGKRTAHPLVFAVLFLLFQAATPISSQAQAVFGSIVGTVTDPTGAVIPNATVTVTDTNKGISQTATTNGSGNFTVSRLIPDTYSIKASAQGFEAAQSPDVTLVADQTQQVDLQLKPGSAAQTVTVTATPPPLETSRAEVAQTLDSQQLSTIPNLNQNASQFELLSPGVQRSSFNIAPTQNPQGTQAVEANGSNYGTLGWELDGTDNREPVLGIIVVNPTIDSLSQMQVVTEDYPAEFGGAVGGFVIADTKSGGNNFHGDAFEYRRSGEFMARDPFTQSPGIPFPGQLYNQFGGSLGGPIRKDRAFFFLDYQGVRQRVGTSITQNVPTTLVRSTCLSGSGPCNLSQYATSIYDPGNGTTYPASAVPASVLTPQGIALISALPAPNSGASGATANNYVASGNGNDDGDQADVRFDVQATQDIHAFGRYDYSLYRLFGAAVFGAAGGAGFGVGNTTGNDLAQNQSAAAGFDWAISPHLLTDFRFGFLDYHVDENMLGYGTNPAAAIGLPNLNQGTLDTSGSPTYNVEDGSISSFGTQGCNCPLLQSEQVYQAADNWTVIHGNHSIRLGADLRYAFNLRNASDYTRSGELGFGNGSTGSGLASVLLGYVDTFQRYDVYSPTAANRQKRGAFYAEDSWRLRPNFTANYGLRWDIVFPETVNAPGQGGFTDLPDGVIRVAGVGPWGTNGGSNVDLSNFGGHLGFAWQVRPNTVIRGAGAQIFDDEGFFGTIFGSAMTHNLPVYIDENVTSGNATGKYQYSYATLPASPSQPTIPSSGNIPLENGYTSQWRPNTLELPKVDQWNLSLQQALTGNMTFTVAYVGNVAERIYPGETYGFSANEPRLPSTPADLTASDPTAPGTCTPGAPCSRNGRRPYYDRFTNLYNGATVYCCNQDITSLFPAARASYNSMQVTLNQRFSHGFNLLANYTWSRALNYGATYFAQNPVVEYGPNDTNRDQLFTMSGFWQIPVGRNKMFLSHANRAVDEVVGGWELAGDTTWEGGLPFTPTYFECGDDQDIDSNYGSPGSSSDCRPDKTGGSFPLNVGALNPVTHERQYFTPVGPLATYGAVSGPFARPAFGTIGSVGRNWLRGPNEYFADASLLKDFPIKEKINAQFEFQAFNVFNHVPLGLPSSTNARCIDCTTGAPGMITEADPAVTGTGLPYMRTLQFSGRIQF
ncbi:MAG TPA: TonB-dependent receptor [Acidobacteriaceae bacterium]|nr:TonB-dependent receptor [Acidobacteriaceae bacterium]